MRSGGIVAEQVRGDVGKWIGVFFFFGRFFLAIRGGFYEKRRFPEIYTHFLYL